MIYAQIHNYVDSNGKSQSTVATKDSFVSGWSPFNVPSGDWLYVDVTGSIAIHSQAEMDAPLIDKAKVNQIAVLTDAYTKAVYRDIAYLNTTFQADQNSQDLITKVLVSLGGVTPPGFSWNDANNKQVPMLLSDLQGLASAILLRAQPLYWTLQTKKAQVRAAVDVSSVTAIIW